MSWYAPDLPSVYIRNSSQSALFAFFYYTHNSTALLELDQSIDRSPRTTTAPAGDIPPALDRNLALNRHTKQLPAGVLAGEARSAWDCDAETERRCR